MRSLLVLAVSAGLTLGLPQSTFSQEQTVPEIALFLTVKTQPGKRDELIALWEKHLKDRAAQNDAHAGYVIARDLADPDTVRMTELYTTKEAFEANGQAPWFGEYMAEAGPLLAGPPEFAMGAPHWVK